jgi:uncharacterized membrane protein
MNQRHIVSSAIASVFALGLVGQAQADDMAKTKDKEKCFGVAKAGQNDCANLSGSHSCAGQTKVDASADDWKYVAKGSCKEMKGMTEAEAKMKSKKA